MDNPSTNGRKLDGTFANGNPGGPGNPHARMTAKFRSMLYECVKDQDFRDIVAALLTSAKAGESWAVSEFFDRVLGKSRQNIDIDNLPESLREIIELVRGPVQK